MRGAAVVAVLALLCACGKPRCAAVEDGCRVRLSWTVSADGRPAGGAEDQTYVEGSGQAVLGLERGLLGMKAGERKTIAVAPAEGFGERDPKAVRSFPRSAFASLGRLQPGMSVDGILDGKAAAGRVVTVGSASVTLDFNPPLAGKTLVYDVQVQDVGP